MKDNAGSRRRVDDLARHTAMQHVFDSMGVGVGIAVEEGALIEVNEALLTLLGIDEDQALGKSLDELLGADALHHERERTFSCPDGRLLCVRVTDTDVTGRDGKVLLRVHSVEDISEQKALERALRKRALLDAVTGLPNRYLLEDRLEHALARRDRDGQQLAVLFVDLDGFKVVNDTAGHRVGDLVLREAGLRIAGSARVCDTVSRWAGDEFVVLCDGLGNAGEAELVAARIARACREPFVVESMKFRLGASVGVAVTEGDLRADADRLLDLADQAMYVDKAARAGTVTARRRASH